jgi:hypothetical protein
VRVLAAPEIEADWPSYDFGSVANGAPLVHDFVIRNIGDENLKIERVVLSCPQCLKAAFDTMTVPPGKKCTLRTVLDLRQLEGSVSREVVVYSNDPKNPSVGFQLTGTVMGYFQVTPLAMYLDYSEGEREASVEIQSGSDLRAPLSRVECSDPSVSATLAKTGGDSYELRVRAADSMKQGTTAVNLKVKTADPTDPVCNVTVYIHNPADLELIPEAIRFQRREDLQTFTLVVRRHSDSAPVLLDAVPPSDKFHCEIDVDQANGDYRIYLSAVGQVTSTPDAGALRLRMRDQNNEEKFVSVPISVN